MSSSSQPPSNFSDVRMRGFKLGNEHSQSLSLSKVHQSLLEHAVELGYADADNSAVIMASRSKATLE